MAWCERLNNLIYKTSVGRINGMILRNEELRIAVRYTNQYQLEIAKAFWNQKPKWYQFWKRDESKEDHIRKNVLERLKEEGLKEK